MRMKRIAASTAVLIAAVSASVMTSTGSAWADGGHTWRNASTGRCLDSNANGDVYTLDCNGGDYQIWDEYQLYGTDGGPTGLWELKDHATGRCLIVRATQSMYAHTSACTTDDTWAYMWSENQPGDINDIPTSYQLQSEETGHVLDSNANGNVYALPSYNQDWYQHWL